MFDETILKDNFYTAKYLAFKRIEEIRRNGLNWEIRMQDRKTCEKKAIDLLSMPMKSISPENIYARQEKNIQNFGALNLLDVDNFNADGTPHQLRFGLTMSNISRYLYLKKKNYEVDKVYFQTLRKRITSLIQAKDDENIMTISMAYIFILFIHDITI